MKLKRRFRSIVNLTKKVGAGAIFGSGLAILFHRKQKVIYSAEQHLEFLIRLDHTAILCRQIISDAYEKVKETGGPLDIDLDAMKIYQMEARRIWSSQITFADQEPSDEDPLLH